MKKRAKTGVSVDVQPQHLWTFNHSSMNVQPENLWTYVHRPLERTSMETLILSELDGRCEPYSPRMSVFLTACDASG